ncbi:hypothetical protein BLS_009067 [Venturia inaequalis]|uniref:Aminoglycoside phosphotransferase domain-containing protein n=1 Tax=Venturia inaequalis TaxID=5025 RepID=A0A8H3V9L6_VENIN|nr:hypothetical protein BLS_009067 [Venturia inaequalis]KAE9967374.1 hypothetical protein EG328_008267 [Venturia inaequalis]KAE9983133.1 hypothetical protein EG327_005601 [Venturia inaequalis]
MTDWTSVPIPFFRTASQLPAPLPSEKDILESKTPLRCDAFYRSVVAVGPHFVVKHGVGITEIEGQNLLFLERLSNPHVAVPKLYAMYKLSNGHLCLVMERLPGESLEALWPSLEEEEKTTICHKLRDAFNFLRTLPSSGYYGGIGRTRIPDHLFNDREANKAVCGPFASETEFTSGLVLNLNAISQVNLGYLDFKVDFYRRHLNTMLSGHSPAFSHGDLQRKNILVLRQASSLEVGLVDWEAAGWYPSYWEYSILFSAMQWKDDWPKWLEQIVDPWPSEGAVLRGIHQDIWF